MHKSAAIVFVSFSLGAVLVSGLAARTVRAQENANGRGRRVFDAQATRGGVIRHLLQRMYRPISAARMDRRFEVKLRPSSRARI
jgi:hypothetical protein